MCKFIKLFDVDTQNYALVNIYKITAIRCLNDNTTEIKGNNGTIVRVLDCKSKF